MAENNPGNVTVSSGLGGHTNVMADSLEIKALAPVHSRYNAKDSI